MAPSISALAQPAASRAEANRRTEATGRAYPPGPLTYPEPAIPGQLPANNAVPSDGVSDPTRVLLVRHGQSTWNATGHWQGQADPPLSELGLQQARAARSHLPELDAVVASDLQRARSTAAAMTDEQRAIELDPRWRERHAGVWTGKTRAEIEEAWPGAIASRQWPEGFEHSDSVVARAMEALASLHERLAGAVVLVVTHGGVIRALEERLGGPDEPVPNLGGRWLTVAEGTVDAGERVLLLDREVPITVPSLL